MNRVTILTMETSCIGDQACHNDDDDDGDDDDGGGDDDDGGDGDDDDDDDVTGLFTFFIAATDSFGARMV